MEDSCFLCSKRVTSIFASTHFFVVYDDFPVRQGHLLLIPVRHVEDLTLLTQAEFCDLSAVIQQMVTHIRENFHADGYNLGVNQGEAAGQTLPHLHIHLIPRYQGDVQNPQGGIRKFLPNPLTEYPRIAEKKP